MAWRAGDVITAARLSQQSSIAELEGFFASDADEWEDWSSTRVEFDDPGVEVSVKGWLSGEAAKEQGDTEQAVIVQFRISISFDGGVNWENGPSVGQYISGDASNIEIVSSNFFRSGTPSGNVLVKAQTKTGSSDVDYRNGILLAELVPE